MDAGVLPVKELSRAKSRLTEVFGNEARLEIARALLADAIDLCTEVEILHWWVVTRDDAVAADAHLRGLGVITDAGEGLNAALTHAAAELAERGYSSMTVLPVDLPLATPGDIRDLLDTGATSDMVVVPSGDDGGTNALYLSPCDLMAPEFGRASMHAHIARAEERAYRCSILALPRLALDIDTPGDVEAFLARPHLPANRTTATLRRVSAP